MTVQTLTTPAPTVEPTLTPDLPDLDPAVVDRIGDEILLTTAAATKVATVKAGTSRRQPGVMFETRSWSRNGNVD
jgi:hypothetical protein